MATSPDGEPLSHADFFPGRHPCPPLSFRCLQMGDLLCLLQGDLSNKDPLLPLQMSPLSSLRGHLQMGELLPPLTGTPSKGILSRRDLHPPLQGDPLQMGDLRRDPSKGTTSKREDPFQGGTPVQRGSLQGLLSPLTPVLSLTSRLPDVQVLFAHLQSQERQSQAGLESDGSRTRWARRGGCSPPPCSSLRSR